jgi:hypothetical protein
MGTCISSRRMDFTGFFFVDFWRRRLWAVIPLSAAPLLPTHRLTSPSVREQASVQGKAHPHQ